MRALYERYGAMILGYLTETLQDQKLAEEQLVIILGDFVGQQTHLTGGDFNWIQLHKFARAKLAKLSLFSQQDVYNVPATISGNNAWHKMNADQQHVFYNSYHCVKPIALIAQQLN